MLLILNTSRGLPARNSEMRTAKFHIFCSLSATKLQGMVAVGDVVVVIHVRLSAGYDAMRGVKCYLFCSLPATKLHGTVAIVVVFVAFG